MLRKKIKRLWRRKPIFVILASAIIVRLLAVFFAQGWESITDIRTGEQPDWLGTVPGQPAYNVFYPGLHYILFSIFRIFGPEDHSLQILITRIIFAAWSLLTVYFGYKITERLANRRSARLAGIILALLWFIPWASVFNLPEMACLPFLILAVWFIVSREDNPAQESVFFLAGLFLGFGFNIDPQTIFFSSGILLASLIQKKFKESVSLFVSFLIPIILVQGSIEYFILDRPFTEVTRHLLLAFKDIAPSETIFPWYVYCLALPFILVPPASLFIFFGFFRNWKKHLPVFLAVIIYCIFYFYFPRNKFAFLLPVIPFMIMSGTAGWNDYLDMSPYWQQRMKWLRYSWIFFWVINLSALLLMIFTDVNEIL